MNNCIPPALGMEMIQKMIMVKFEVELDQQQLQNLMAAQPQELRNALQEDSTNVESLDRLINTISEAITGMHYPTAASTSYYKKCFLQLLTRQKGNYFKQFGHQALFQKKDQYTLPHCKKLPA